MQNFASFDASIVTLSECQQNLHEYFPDDILSNEILLRFAFLYQLGHVTILAEFHNNIYFFIVALHYFFNVLDNIRMIEFAETINFADYLGPFFFT